MIRREYLAAMTGTTGALVAGCLQQGSAPGADGDGGGDDDGDGADDGNGDDDRDVEPSVVNAAVVTTGSDCMSGDDGDAVDVSFGADGVVLEGVARAPTPCHVAAIESMGVTTGALTVRVALESLDVTCVECVGAVEYVAAIELENVGGLDTVTVEHGDSGETFTTRRGEDDESGGTESGDGSGDDGSAS